MLAGIKVFQKDWLIGILPLFLPRVLSAIFAAGKKGKTSSTKRLMDMSAQSFQKVFQVPGYLSPPVPNSKVLTPCCQVVGGSGRLFLNPQPYEEQCLIADSIAKLPRFMKPT